MNFSTKDSFIPRFSCPSIWDRQNSKNSQRGQALLESLLGLTVGILLIFLLLNVIYFAFLKNQIEYLSYESLICKVSLTHRSTNSCEQTFHRKLQPLIPFGRVRSTYFSKSGSEYRIRVTLNFINLSGGPLFQWTLQKSLDSRLTVP